jgi:hypothetical protein
VVTPQAPTSPSLVVVVEGLQYRQLNFYGKGALFNHTQHHDRPSYALMAFRQSIITLVARRGLIDGSGPAAHIKRPPLAFALSRA